MKPIEPGCLCLVVGCYEHPEDLGKSVTAIRYLPPGDHFTPEVNGWCEGNSWLCQSPEITSRPGGDGTKGFALYDPKHLRRIDGHEPEQATEQKKEVSTC